MTGELTIRPMTESDIPAITSLADRIWHKHYPNIISVAQIDYMLELMYSAPALKKQMEEGSEFLLALVDGKIMGYVAILPTGKEEYLLDKLYVDQSLQKRGVGGALLKAALAKHPDCRVVRLNVNRMNINAINFYFKQGFIIEKPVIRKLGQDYVMDDFVMIYRPVHQSQ
jgi:GNAT superfamily N-acetyltransferase